MKRLKLRCFNIQLRNKMFEQVKILRQPFFILLLTEQEVIDKSTFAIVLGEN